VAGSDREGNVKKITSSELIFPSQRTMPTRQLAMFHNTAYTVLKREGESGIGIVILVEWSLYSIFC
jgi:hypothetical protein